MEEPWLDWYDADLGISNDKNFYLPTPPLSPALKEEEDSLEGLEDEEVDIINTPGQSILKTQVHASVEQCQEVSDFFPDTVLINNDPMWCGDHVSRADHSDCETPPPPPVPSARQTPLAWLDCASGGEVSECADYTCPISREHSYHMRMPANMTNNGPGDAVVPRAVPAFESAPSPPDTDEEVDVVTITDTKSISALNPVFLQASAIKRVRGTSLMSTGASNLKVVGRKLERLPRHHRPIIMSCGTTTTSTNGGHRGRHTARSYSRSYGRHYRETEGRGSQHNELERKRRNDLKDSFKTLRRLVPDISMNHKASKVIILDGATEYTRTLVQQERLLNTMLNAELETNRWLKKRIIELKTLRQ